MDNTQLVEKFRKSICAAAASVEKSGVAINTLIPKMLHGMPIDTLSELLQKAIENENFQLCQLIKTEIDSKNKHTLCLWYKLNNL